MLRTETMVVNGRELIKTWSDTYTIERDGVEYDSALDPVEFGRTYTETANPLEVVDPEPLDDTGPTL